MRKQKRKSMATCKNFFLSPSYCYKIFKCRCFICRKWKKEMDTIPNREKAKIISREWRKKNPEKSRQNAKNYQKNNPRQVLKWQLKKYNLTLDDYDKLIKNQNNICAICGKKNKGLTNSKYRLSIDHDKKTKKVRGLLCGGCNVGIGHLKHNINILKNAIKYLKKI